MDAMVARQLNDHAAQTRPCGCCVLLLACVVYVPRWSSKYSSPYQVTNESALSSSLSKKSSTELPMCTRGSEADGVADATAPAKLLNMLPGRTAATITLAEHEEGRVSPGPWTCAARCFRLTSPSCASAVYRLRRRHVADGLEAIERHPVEGGVGNLLMLFQLSFWVRNRFMPARRQSWGSWLEYPKVSGEPERLAAASKLLS